MHGLFVERPSVRIMSSHDERDSGERSANGANWWRLMKRNEQEKRVSAEPSKSIVNNGYCFTLNVLSERYKYHPLNIIIITRTMYK